MQKVFENYDLLNNIQIFCNLAEKLNFHRINKTCYLLKINCNICLREPILPIFLENNNPNIFNEISCFECFSNNNNISNHSSYNFNKVLLLWEELDNLNMINMKFGNGKAKSHKKCYLKCTICKLRCFDSTWLYHHKINYCYKLL